MRATLAEKQEKRRQAEARLHKLRWSRTMTTLGAPELTPMEDRERKDTRWWCAQKPSALGACAPTCVLALQVWHPVEAPRLATRVGVALHGDDGAHFPEGALYLGHRCPAVLPRRGALPPPASSLPPPPVHVLRLLLLLLLLLSLLLPSSMPRLRWGLTRECSVISCR